MSLYGRMAPAQFQQTECVNSGHCPGSYFMNLLSAYTQEMDDNKL